MAEVRLNLYQKIQKCRVELQKKNLKKTGKNKFAGFEYYELGDFLPSVNELLNYYKLFNKFDLNKEIATLEIIDTETKVKVGEYEANDSIMFSCPVASANIKGANEIQALGGQITYLKRYLYMMAMEIVENDMYDAISGKEEKETKKKTVALKQEVKGRQDLVNFCKEKSLDINEIAKEYKLNANSTEEDFEKALNGLKNAYEEI